MKDKFQVIGIMSGTSMDGVDLACCEFQKVSEQWRYKMLHAETVPYPEIWRVRLSQLPLQPISLYPKTHAFYGRYLGLLVKDFITRKNCTPDFISSHGHTIFHQPESGFTAQVGDGAAIAAETGLPVVSDFRVMDLALGGQGAPLVPVGDGLLFPDYDACLNLGGISNISFSHNGIHRAFDISPCNIVLNRVARRLGQPFDDEGKIAESGQLDNSLLEALNALPYYSESGAKSLGREWIATDFWPIVKAFPDTSEEAKMTTLVEHIAFQIAVVIRMNGIKKVLVTGGGAFNNYMLQRVRTQIDAELFVPETELVQYKEALIFAFLGVLRVRNQTNVWSSVTGSARDHIAGALHGNFNAIIN